MHHSFFFCWSRLGVAVDRKEKGPVYGMVNEMGRTYYNVATLLGLWPMLLMKLLFLEGGN